MKINSKRDFKRVLNKMINAFPCAIPEDYAFCHNMNFRLKNYKGIPLHKICLIFNKRIYLLKFDPKDLYYYEEDIIN